MKAGGRGSISPPFESTEFMFVRIKLQQLIRQTNAAIDERLMLCVQCK